MVTLDTRRSRATPEGVELSLHVAGPVVRLLAWTIDFLVLAVIYVCLSILFGVLGAAGMGLMLVSVFLVSWFYPVVSRCGDAARPSERAPWGSWSFSETARPST